VPRHGLVLQIVAVGEHATEHAPEKSGFFRREAGESLSIALAKMVGTRVAIAWPSGVNASRSMRGSSALRARLSKPLASGRSMRPVIARENSEPTLSLKSRALNCRGAQGESGMV
jgi:hypothetical protein